MRVTYNHERDILEIHWCTDERGKWRKARANIDLLVSEANETLGISISAASWLVPQLAKIHADLEATLTMSSWVGYRPPPPSMLNPTPNQLLGITARNAQPMLPRDRDIPRAEKPERALIRRGICRHCGANAPNRQTPVKDGWFTMSTCAECAESRVPDPAPSQQPAATLIDPGPDRHPMPWRTPNPHTGPRGRSDRPRTEPPTKQPGNEPVPAQSSTSSRWVTLGRGEPPSAERRATVAQAQGPCVVDPFQVPQKDYALPGAGSLYRGPAESA